MQTSNKTVERLCLDILEGETVIPDFQRDYVWKPDDVKDLLVSIVGDYYIGTMLFMTSILEESPFALKLFEGVVEVNQSAKPSSIVKIILDGQQRLSSLFYALYEPAIPLAGRKTPLRFYLNIQESISGEWEKSIEFRPTSKKHTQIAESDTNLIAFKEFRDIGKLYQRLQQQGHGANIPAITKIVNSFMNYTIQFAELERSTPLDRVVETFERINRTGLPLKTIDLLVARLYQHGIKLRESIAASEEYYRFLKEEDDFDKEFILRLMCISRGLDVRKKAILELKPENFQADWDAACDAMEEAYVRITSRDYYGALSFKKRTPFTTMVVPLAAMIAFIEKSKIGSPANYAKIDQWYWCSVFDNRYNEAVNTLSASDYTKMKLWLTDESKVPDFIEKFSVEKVDLQTGTRTSSIYKGVISLIVKEGARDFRTGKYPVEAHEKIEEDHIFPRSKGGIDTILNRTLISSNEHKSDKMPKEFFGAAEVLNGRQILEEILSSHLIDANGCSALMKNDHQEFLKSRELTVKAKIKSLVPSALTAEQLAQQPYD